MNEENDEEKTDRKFKGTRNELENEQSWDNYMNAKKMKLQDQFISEASKNSIKCDIFKGISIFINGYTDPPASQIKQLMMDYGGIYHHYYINGKTTYTIAANLPEVKKKQLRNSSMKIIRPEWITDSIKAGTMLDYKRYLLLQNYNSGINQYFEGSNDSISPEKNKADDKLKTSTRNANDEHFLSEFYSNSRLHHLSTMGMKFKSLVSEMRSEGREIFPGKERLKQWKLADGQDENYEWSEETCIMHIDMDCFFVSVGTRNRPDLKGVPIAVAHARTNKTSNKESEDIDDNTNNVHQNIHKQENSHSETLTIDKKLDSMSEIASCNYEARKFGIKNGMFLGQALKLCPQLETIPYDFRAYEEVSHAFYNHVMSYTLDVEAVSCDEMFVDCTEILRYANVDALTFATFLRKEIKDIIGCSCSTGFGSNRLLSRLATKFAKPDGQFHIRSNEVVNFIGNVSVSELPGIGRSTNQKLSNMGVKTCQDLQKIPLATLQREFGNKLGSILKRRSFGEDDRPLNFGHQRKSLSADVNYGIRFSDQKEAEIFLKKLSVEVENRLNDEKMKGKSVTLKLMIKAQNAPEPAKFMGHGVCDCITKTITLNEPTSDSNVIYRIVVKIMRDLKICPTSMRGIGIHVSRLEKNQNFKAMRMIDQFLKIPNKPYEKDVQPKPSMNVSLKIPDNDSSNTRIPKNEETEQITTSYSTETLSAKCPSPKFDRVPCGFYIITENTRPEINPSIPIVEMVNAIEAWIATEKIPLLSDVEMLFNYIKRLASKKEFESLNFIVEKFQRYTENSKQMEWKIVYQTLAELVSQSCLE